MKSKADGFGANERMFSGGIRGRLHLARFNWFAREIINRNCSYDAVLELGCFDGKLIDFLPSKPIRYVGFDKNWEQGLNLAAEKWKSYPSFSFHMASVPEDMNLSDNDRFDIAVVMETLEHLPPNLLDGYLRKIAQHLDGFLFVTIPNEKGIVFLAKWLIKRVLGKDAASYTIAEFLNATLGRMEKVAEKRRDQKGSGYSQGVCEQLSGKRPSWRPIVFAGGPVVHQ